jgi:hypothetical protein
MIESPLLTRIVDLLIVDHPMRYALLALGFLQAYAVPQLLKGPTWRPPHVVFAAALVYALLSVVDLASGLKSPAEKRDLIVALWVAATLVGGWACLALVRHFRRLTSAIAQEQTLRARHQA